MTTFNNVDLFGGAMVAELPSGFADVSNIRQVPDNQEVYLDKDGFTSIMFDITERLDDAGTDDEALKAHFQDIIESSDGVKVWSSDVTKLINLPDGVPSYTLVATKQPVAGERVRTPSPDFTAILLTLVRLESQKTDVVITINVPHIKGEYVEEEVDLAGGKPGRLLEAGFLYRDQILKSFDIKDWGLFVQDA